MGLPSTIIVIGASAGGLSPLKTIVSQLSTGIDAAVFAVQHVDPAGPALLAEILGRESSLPVTTARHGEIIERGRIYTAPPGRHLMFRGGKIDLVYGTKVNFTRPSVDVAFRSAAKEFGPRAIGVILSGYLDDGTAGLLSVKRAGGITVVQDPADAEIDSMPRTAARYCKPDHQVTASAIGPLLNKLAPQLRGDIGLDMGRDVDDIAAIIASDVAEQEKDERKGKLSIFSCPECGGTLWQACEEGPPRFQCHIGHAYTGDHLLKQKLETVERSGWYTMRALKETMLLTNELSLLAEEEGNRTTAEEFRRQSRRADNLLYKLEELLMQSHDPAA